MYGSAGSLSQPAHKEPLSYCVNLAAGRQAESRYYGELALHLSSKQMLLPSLLPSFRKMRAVHWTWHQQQTKKQTTK